ncbi:uncharacterized protein C7orf50 homolog isoform X2 [Acinonyx jubatus]|uniref:Uncharacterized protein C7orf50 homolog isoform X2 n=1 Tax=Acinonyx jubatus TaxID=32536 RepID=A0ABM3PBT2_ACIJB|nr:uncharacterized protein C7orf50 homolog isoform X2 [Acinonyx jubatus]
MGRETGSTWGRCSCGFPPPLSGPGQGLLTGRPPGEGPVAATWWCGGHRQVVPSLHSRSRQPPSTGSLRGPRLASPACFADPAGAGVRAHVQAPGPRPHPRAPPRLRHRPAGWIRFQPSRAGVTCAVRGRCGRAARGPLAARDAEATVALAGCVEGTGTFLARDGWRPLPASPVLGSPARLHDRPARMGSCGVDGLLTKGSVCAPRVLCVPFPAFKSLLRGVSRPRYVVQDPAPRSCAPSGALPP